MSTVIEHARADLDAGRPWMARDRLVSALRDRHDDEILDLLARFMNSWVIFRRPRPRAAGRQHADRWAVGADHRLRRRPA